MITRTTETAIRILLDLSQQDPKRVIPLVELHGRIGGSQTYLAKVTAALTRARIVRSNRGAQGGLLLARPLNEITLLHVVTAIQGAPAPAYCVDGENKPQLTCAYHVVMENLHSAIEGVLNGTTVADLAKQAIGKDKKGHVNPICLQPMTAE